jgi:hypothetical protein
MKNINIKYIIENTSHAEQQGEYESFNDALNELKKRSNIAWDKEPNACPCVSSSACSSVVEIMKS